MGGHIDCYIDLNSIYSYFAFLHLRSHLDTLASHGVSLAFHPVYLPELQRRSGNRVIWTVAARQAWLERYELPRSKRDFGVPRAGPPAGDLNSLFDVGPTRLPLRALLAIRGSYPRGVYDAAWHWLYHCFWTPPQQRIKDEGPLREALAAMPAGFAGEEADTSAGSKKQFSGAQVDAIMIRANEKDVRDELERKTDEALGQGGFGAPWLMVRNSAGAVEPFFGSDRFGQIYEFLGLPFNRLELLPRDGPVKANM
ncbi:thioredoxin-like protein [Biscogniauxia marginata]|nr:thioredoxin-like protein [Biscogniauxia marginata]